jgi:hypothetical protein
VPFKITEAERMRSLKPKPYKFGPNNRTWDERLLQMAQEQHARTQNHGFEEVDEEGDYDGVSHAGMQEIARNTTSQAAPTGPDNDP